MLQEAQNSNKIASEYCPGDSTGISTYLSVFIRLLDAAMMHDEAMMLDALIRYLSHSFDT